MIEKDTDKTEIGKKTLKHGERIEQKRHHCSTHMSDMNNCLEMYLHVGEVLHR